MVVSCVSTEAANKNRFTTALDVAVASPIIAADASASTSTFAEPLLIAAVPQKALKQNIMNGFVRLDE